MKEIACQFGENKRLSGILTRPINSSTKQALVLVSVGFMGKFGPFRIYTSIARRAAHLGFEVFRFDLGDLGYSQPGDPNSSLKVKTRQEIQAALDYLQTTFGIDQFILGGLCSGAEDSYRYAEEDSRVVGLIMIDPFAYRTRGFILYDLILRVHRKISRGLFLNPPDEERKKPSEVRRLGFHNLMYRAWKKTLQVLFFSFLDEERRYPPEQGPFIKYRQIPSHESKRILKILLARNVWLHFLYTNSRDEWFNHPSQIGEMFPELKKYPKLILDYLPQIIHTQILEEDRIYLFEAIEQGLIRSLKEESQDLMMKYKGYNKNKKRPWVFVGIITGFVVGLSYITFGV